MVTRSASKKGQSAPSPTKKTVAGKAKATTTKKETKVTTKNVKKATETKASPKKISVPKTKPVVGGGSVLLIEACKSWNAFKTRAAKVEAGVKKALPGVSIIINGEKPRKGTFELKIEGSDKPILSLVGMARPFPALKALDIDDVIKQVVDAMN